MNSDRTEPMKRAEAIGPVAPRRDGHVAYDPLAQPYNASTDPAARPLTPPSVRVLRQMATQPYPFDEQPGEAEGARPAPVPQPEGLPKKGRDPADGDSPIA